MEKFQLDILTKSTYLKNHVILFEPESLSLFLCDLKGILLDKKYIGFLIDDICIIDDNNILIRIFYNIIIKIEIINNTISIRDKLFIKEQKIYDLIYIKESKLIVMSFKNIIGIWDIDSLHKNPIQIIYNESLNLFNFNSNLFISYKHNKISFYKKTNNIILYQLSAVLTLDNNDKNNESKIIKLDKITLMITQNNDIYLIDIRNMMTKKKFKFINVIGKINSLYKKDKDIYLNFGNYWHTFRYNKNNLEIIKTIKKSELKFFKYKNFNSKPNPIIAIENENILNYYEPIKFFSFKNKSIKFKQVRKFLFPSIFFTFNNHPFKVYDEYKIERSIESMTSSLYKSKERSEIKKSQKNHIIINKNNYNKRNKLKKMNKIKTRNNPKNFKNNFR